MASKTRTALLATAIMGGAVFALGLVCGLLYEQAQRARDRERFPQIGRWVDIGGRTLNLDCAGTGQPAIILQSGSPWPSYPDPKKIFENGAPRPGYAWVAIQRELAQSTTTCWYDRAGSGWSDLGPYPRDSAAQARDLHALLQRAGIPPPYILVAEASAALDARVFTDFYPAEAAGLVLADGIHPDLLNRARPGSRRMERLPRFVGHSQDLMAQFFNQAGLYRLGAPNRAAPAPPKGITPAEWETIWHLTRSSKARSALIQDIAAWPRSVAEARRAGSLGDRPLVVLSSEKTMGPETGDLWMELQADLTRLSTRGKQVIIRGVSGDLIYQAPDAITQATRQVLASVRP